MSVVIRAAKTTDVKKIRAIVDTYAVERKLLSKETVTLFESVQEFVVAEVDGEAYSNKEVNSSNICYGLSN